MNELTGERPRVLVRRLRPEDAEAVRRFFAGLSSRSLYRRFHSPVAQVPSSYLDRLFAAAHDDDVVVVAVEIDRPSGCRRVVGIAELLRSSVWSVDPSWAPSVRSFDLAFVVADERQRQGLGRRLIAAALAREPGADVIRADVQSDNLAALKLLRAVLPTGQAHVDTGAVVFEAETRPERHVLHPVGSMALAS